MQPESTLGGEGGHCCKKVDLISAPEENGHKNA